MIPNVKCTEGMISQFRKAFWNFKENKMYSVA